jgi:alpha-glucosidase (family GH31 glycosyl hydrolase)
MPWVYGQRGIDLMRKYFTLRTQLIPYLYTYSWRAHQDSVPILRPLYLQYPELEEAYRHPYEYFFGEQMLVAPVLDASGQQTIYLPPGDWRDFFSGKRYQGDTTFTAHYRVDETPVFVREGAIIPEQRAGDYSDVRPLDVLVLSVYGSGDGMFELYEDDGSSLDYEARHAHTTIAHAVGSDAVHRLTIEPTQGSYPGQAPARSYEVHIYADGKPSSVSVNGREAGPWTWDAERRVAVVMVSSQSIHERARIEWR